MAPEGYVTKAAQHKKETAERLKKLLEANPVVALVNVKGMPAAQFQSLRAKLGSEVTVFMCKKTLMAVAFDKVKDKPEGVGKLASCITGMPALLFTSKNPFTLANALQKSKSKAPAKPGQTLPHDIIIPAGPTSFAPGPMISELSSVGIKTGVEGGKIAVKQAATVGKAGDVVSPKLASLLMKFGIEPMDVGLNLIAALEGGVLYSQEVLAVPPEAYISDLTRAAAESNALAVFLELVTPETAEQLIGLAGRHARHIASEQGIVVAELTEELIGKAETAARALGKIMKLPETADKAQNQSSNEA